MNILSELQNHKLGLIELISMGFNVYLKNLKPILLLYCTLNLPFLIIISAYTYELQSNPEALLEGFSLSLFWVILMISTIVGMIYFISISMIVDNYLHEKNTNYRNIVKKIVANLIPLLFLSFRFGINYILRCFLFFIPGIIYLINNQYFVLAFILRDKKGKDCFDYSQSLVKGNWWKVFWFNISVSLIVFLLQIIFKLYLDIVPFISDFWVFLLSQTLPQFIAIGIFIGYLLLFFNLDFQQNLES